MSVLAVRTNVHFMSSLCIVYRIQISQFTFHHSSSLKHEPRVYLCWKHKCSTPNQPNFCHLTLFLSLFFPYHLSTIFCLFLPKSNNTSNPPPATPTQNPRNNNNIWNSSRERVILTYNNGFLHLFPFLCLLTVSILSDYHVRRVQQGVVHSIAICAAEVYLLYYNKRTKFGTLKVTVWQSQSLKRTHTVVDSIVPAYGILMGCDCDDDGFCC